MKTKLSLILAGLFLLSQAGTGWAQTAFQVQATVPNATGITMAVSYSPANGATFTTETGTALSFDAYGGMKYDSVNKVYNPSVYYAIDIATSGGGSGRP